MNVVKFIFLILIPMIVGILLALFGGMGLIAAEDKTLFGILLGGGIVHIIFASIFNGARKRKCDTCGKWNALSEIKRDLISKEETYITKTLTDKRKNSQGQVVETIERHVVVPGYKMIYEVREECKFCRQVYVHEETKNIEK